MAVVIPWISRPSVKDATGLVELLEFDASFDEQHEFAVKVTEHPVEFGKPISDHITDKPDEVLMTIGFTDHPLDMIEALEADRARRRFTVLRNLLRAHEPVTLVTGLDVYPSMVLQRISVTRTSETGLAIEASLSFKEVLIANSLDVLVPEEILGETARRTGQSPVDGGAIGTEEVGEALDQENSSVAYRHFYGD